MRRREDKFPDNGFEAWGGYMQAKIAKLEDQFSDRAKKEECQESDIFCGVSIYVNGYTKPSADELKVLMSKHGGVYHTYQRKEDFIIASNLPDTKVKNMSLTKVVKPEWITESIASNRLLDFRDFLLYRNSRTQPKLNFNSGGNSSLGNNKNETHLLQTLKSDSLSNVYEEAKQNESEECLVNKFPEKVSPTASCSKSVQRELGDSYILRTDIAKTAVDPNFITEFYSNSRLHHISQLGSYFKQHVNDLRDNSNFVFPARVKLKEKIKLLNNTNLSPLCFERGKTIMHIDMDCFFVSVGLRNRPELRGKPVAVTHSKGGHGRTKRPGVDRNTEFSLYKQRQAKKLGQATGVSEENIEIETRVDNITDEDDKYGSMSEIASCSYEARAKGLSNGMFMGAALRLCPDLQTIPYDFDGYKEVAYTLYNTIAQYTLDIEAVSCDEMYVDCTDLLSELNANAHDFATILREEIRSKTGCPCSTGFGGNRLQARLATKKAKPDGQFFLTADLVEDFIYDIKLRDLPGVGRQIAQKLEVIGHHTCGSLQSLTLAALKAHLGNKTGAQLFDQCRGRDLNPLTFQTIRKSVSAEVNYGIRFENYDQCVEFLKQLSAEVHTRMQQFKVLGKCITLKLMMRAENAPVETAKFMGHGFCDVINKSTSLNIATNDVEVITSEVLLICKKQKVDPKEMRGIGIQVTKLEPINAKDNKGAINKFLVTKPVKQNDVDSAQNSRPSSPLVPKVLTTPKKLQIKSPIKKSPVLDMKSPGRRRGRPPKNKKLPVPSHNLMNRFLQGQRLVKEAYKNPMIKEQSSYVKEMPLEVRQPLQEPAKEGLLDLPWEKVRELLRAWLDSSQTPLSCDINMIAAYMRDMVVNKNIDKLSILINFFRRRTKEMDIMEWLSAYNHVVEQVQNAMIAIYGKTLWIDD